MNIMEYQLNQTLNPYLVTYDMQLYTIIPGLLYELDIGLNDQYGAKWLGLEIDLKPGGLIEIDCFQHQIFCQTGIEEYFKHAISLEEFNELIQIITELEHIKKINQLVISHASQND